MTRLYVYKTILGGDDFDALTAERYGWINGALPDVELDGFADIGVAGEVAFSVAEKTLVESTYQAWLAKGLSILQTPVEMDFGYTFVALDPDGHRLRVFASSDA